MRLSEVKSEMKTEVVMTGGRCEKLSQRDTFLRKVVGDHGRPQPMLGDRCVVCSAERESSSLSDKDCKFWQVWPL